jgi:hypothetical protein
MYFTSWEWLSVPSVSKYIKHLMYFSYYGQSGVGYAGSDISC